ncbi:hypothetical protein [Legionella yabuuchiae]|uniref:hypothetical protein n=1 Tax=Legionella yabuuchiae TaxID=376727 RepID=UPI001054D295|nr:hypothetical protein [Legionella yabuuchiae]
MNQNCAEVMLIKATQLVMSVRLQFQYEQDIQDSQIDISSAFLFSPDEQKQLWHSGNEKEKLEHDLKKLDKNNVYLLRTGTNGGAGHWQTLYFDKTRHGWINYSTEVNNYQLTENDRLSERGTGLLSPFAKWGADHGQYAFLLVEASPQNLIKAANYLYDYRTLGQDQAEEKSWERQENFYAALKAEEDACDVGEALFAQINPYKQPFDELLNELKIKTDELIEKGGKTNPHHGRYKQAKLAAEQLITTLEDAREQFFNHEITQNTFDAFKNNCNNAIQNAGEEFQKHRGWHAVNPILKGLLGVLAALTIIPALVAHSTAKHGYAGTFFNTPKTDSAGKLQSFQDNLEDKVLSNLDPSKNNQ